MDENYVLVRFEGNNSTRWDGKETEVLGRTVVRLGRRGVDGLEKAEVHWGKGKGKKVWKCVMLEGGEEEEEAAEAPPKKLRCSDPSPGPSNAALAGETEPQSTPMPTRRQRPGCSDPSPGPSNAPFAGETEPQSAPMPTRRPGPGHGPGVGKKGLEQVLEMRERELERRELMDAGPSKGKGKGKKENVKGSGAKRKSSKARRPAPTVFEWVDGDDEDLAPPTPPGVDISILDELEGLPPPAPQATTTVLPQDIKSLVAEAVESALRNLMQGGSFHLPSWTPIPPHLHHPTTLFPQTPPNPHNPPPPSPFMSSPSPDLFSPSHDPSPHYNTPPPHYFPSVPGPSHVPPVPSHVSFSPRQSWAPPPLPPPSRPPPSPTRQTLKSPILTVEKYSSWIVPGSVGRLASKLARECVFGADIMATHNLSEEGLLYIKKLLQ